MEEEREDRELSDIIDSGLEYGLHGRLVKRGYWLKWSSMTDLL